jgi:hypothetical protein
MIAIFRAPRRCVNQFLPTALGCFHIVIKKNHDWGRYEYFDSLEHKGEFSMNVEVQLGNFDRMMFYHHLD